ncbi:hypothetical protein KZZ52_26645 [Dactylosporangium sp. AC04546]|uniref:hypothetical protein n=1 Tax=Dactylosporangium sp. AC04546 TaxID=2862460 RepID=UPI001EE0A95B|nr:hypothetical protein [Dactylosporangium sp. AC04546]WVK88849.1 hypothetical protein KZZ52_26645 [Dactylosporangium sp. AC04546]
MSPEPDGDPNILARQIAHAATGLARCLTTDITIDPEDVIGPLIAASHRLHEIAIELSLAATPVSEASGLAARQAAERFLQAKDDLAQSLARLPEEPPRGTMDGQPRDPFPE